MGTRQLSTRYRARPQGTARAVANRKEQLRDAALTYLLQHGLANVSLRPMAAQLGTSARILMFHFKSKDGLLREVMQQLDSRLQSSFLTVSESGDRRTPLLKRFWIWATERRNARYLRLLYEAQIVAVQNPKAYGRYLKRASSDWQRLVLQKLSQSVRSKAMATLCIAMFDGLFLELMNTGDAPRLTRALDYFIAMARQFATASGVRRPSPA